MFKLTVKQYWSRVSNAHSHLTSSTQEGERARKEMYRLTRKSKYTNVNFQKNLQKGKTFTKREIASDISKIEKRKTEQLKTSWRKVKGTKKTKLKNFKSFRRANAHMTVTDFSQIEFIYNSP